MKEHSHIRSLLLSSIEGTLDDVQQRAVEDHVASCDSCRRYFETMSTALLPATDRRSPGLVLDPFLPVRVKAIARQSSARKGTGLSAAFSWSFRTVAFLVAVVLGIVLGEKLSTQATPVTSQRIIAEYSAIFTTQGIDDRLQTVTQANREVSK